LRTGSFALVDAGPGVVAYRRTAGDDDRYVAVNFAASPAPISLPDGRWAIDEASGDGAAIEGGTLLLGPDQAVVVSSVA
jgi:hypothetical protein